MVEVATGATKVQDEQARLCVYQSSAGVGGANLSSAFAVVAKVALAQSHEMCIVEQLSDLLLLLQKHFKDRETLARQQCLDQ